MAGHQGLAAWLQLEPSLNCTAYVADALGALRAGDVPHGPELVAVVQEYCAASLRLLAAMSVACCWRNHGCGADHGPGRDTCPEVGYCHTGLLRRAMLQFSEGMRRAGRVLSRQLLREKATPHIVALVSSLETSAPDHRVTPQCGLLTGHVLSEQEDVCKEIFAVSANCARSLNEEAQRAGDLLWFAQPQSDVQFPDWHFDGRLGAQRDDTLTDLLGSLDTERLASGGDRLLVAEVGVMAAPTSVALLRRFSALRMFLVDPYHVIDNGDSEKKLTQHDWAYVTAENGPFQRTQPYRSRATHVVQASVEAAMWIGRGSLDLVFIDGDHSYEGVKEDIQAWWPTVRPGGIMAGHDYTFGYPGVVQAVSEFAFESGLRLSLAPEVFWFQKPGAKGTM